MTAGSSTFLKWLKSGVEKLIDPEKQLRVERVAKLLRREISNKKDQFSLSATLAGKDLIPADILAAKEDVYRGYLVRFWEDQSITEKEDRTLSWLQKVLELNEKVIRQLHEEYGKAAFEIVLGQSMQDGYIDGVEKEKLNSIAKWLGHDTRSMLKDFFAYQGESFLQAIFLGAIRDGKLLDKEWSSFLQSAENLGLSRDEAIQIISPHSRRFVEHVLADAKSDGRITDAEESQLKHLITQLALPADFREYVYVEIEEIQRLTLIEDGQLPSLQGPFQVELKAGELVHFEGRAHCEQTHYLKNGPDVRKYRGTITITDDRLIFSSAEKPFVVGLRSLISIKVSGNKANIQGPKKATGCLHFLDDPKAACMILSCATKRANQTMVQQGASAPSRHIPRDVRQRVWQTYGGRCVECSADDYLEYDHIIPVARGGSNSETNVQLLCRRCNSKKSDAI